jgi:hypothetical protein
MEARLALLPARGTDVGAGLTGLAPDRDNVAGLGRLVAALGF